MLFAHARLIGGSQGVDGRTQAICRLGTALLCDVGKNAS